MIDVFDITFSLTPGRYIPKKSSKELFIDLEWQNYTVSITHKISADYDRAVDEMVHLKPRAETLGTTQGRKCEKPTYFLFGLFI